MPNFPIPLRPYYLKVLMPHPKDLSLYLHLSGACASMLIFSLLFNIIPSWASTAFNKLDMLPFDIM